MLEKTVEQVQGMLNLLNHSITLFEKDYTQLKTKYEAEVQELQAKHIDEHKEKLSNLVRDHQEILTSLTKEELNNFTTALSEHLDNVYKSVREKIAQQNMKDLFKQHGDQIVPLILKYSLRYIFQFRFIRKK